MPYEALASIYYGQKDYEAALAYNQKLTNELNDVTIEYQRYRLANGYLMSVICQIYLKQTGEETQQIGTAKGMRKKLGSDQYGPAIAIPDAWLPMAAASQQPPDGANMMKFRKKLLTYDTKKRRCS